MPSKAATGSFFVAPLKIPVMHTDSSMCCFKAGSAFQMVSRIARGSRYAQRMVLRQLQRALRECCVRCVAAGHAQCGAARAPLCCYPVATT